MTPTALTCVVADDHPPIVDALTRLLASMGVDVVATAADGATALAAVEEHRPQVCLADVRMPGLDGVELSRRIAAVASETAVVLYSGAADPALVVEALDAGARGFALKDAPLADLGTALTTVANGGIYVDPVLAAAVVSPARVDLRKLLSNREREVLKLLADGMSYAEIGAHLFLSPDTVRAHAQRAMTKLGAKTRTQAVAIALRESVFA